ncbi:MAG: FAD-dependent monooxygenase [Lacisediminihabitans sp.]
MKNDSSGKGKPRHTPVLIVGGGPIGLALASDLGSRGVSALLIERSENRVNPAVKIMDIGVRTMEFCRRLGVTDRIKHWGFPQDYPLDNAFITSMTGVEIARIKMPTPGELGPSAFSPEWQVHCPQTSFDPIMRDLALSFDGIEIEYQQEFLSLTQDADGVTANVLDRATGETYQITADYLVGCDGFTSAVRSGLNIPFSGRGVVDHSLNHMFRSAEFNNLGVIDHAKRYVMVGEQGTWATVMAVNGVDLWRLTFYGANDQDVSDIDIEAAMRKIGGDFEYELAPAERWVRRALVADRFQEGRVYLAGDAVHPVPPNGGFGMNTGFADSMNLAWKLAAAVQGWAGPGVVESYESERRPIALLVVEEALANYDRLTAATQVAHVTDLSPEGEAARKKLGRQLHDENMKAWKPVGIHLGYQYVGSPIIDYGTSTPAPFEAVDFVPEVRPGKRAPHGWLSDGRSILDLFGTGYVILRMGETAPDVSGFVSSATERGLPIVEQTIREKELITLYGVPLVVVRPDGHVAWCGDELPVDSDALINMLAGRSREFSQLSR